MKKLYIILLLFVVIACNTHNNIEGDDCGKDNIHFSKQSLSFGASGGKDSVTSKNGYNFYGMSFDDNNDVFLFPLKSATVLFCRTSKFFSEIFDENSVDFCRQSYFF